MYALKEILTDFIEESNILMSSFDDSSKVSMPAKFKHFIKKRIYEVDKINHIYMKCELRLKKDEDDEGRVKITVLPHNLYSLVYFSIGSAPDLSLLYGMHNEMNLDPIKYGDWTFYFDKKDQPIAINKNLGRSIKGMDKFNL